MTVAADWARTRSAWRWEPALLLLLLIAFSALALLFPFSGDDWAWGSSIGIDRLDSSFRDYNGRYLGNLSILALARMGDMARIVTALVLTASLFLIVDVAGFRRVSGYLFAGVLFLAMPLGIWRQSVVWLSGFSNYALAALMTLVFVRYAAKSLTSGYATTSKLSLIVTGGAAFGAALFMEHVTIYLVVAGFAALASFWAIYRRFSAGLAAWALGATLGALVMFSNGAYRKVATGEDRYQSLGGGDDNALVAAAKKTLDTIIPQAVLDNTVLNLVLVALLCLLVALVRDHQPVATWQRRSIVGLSGVFLASSALRPAFDVQSDSRVVRLLAVLAVGSMFAALALASQTALRNRGDRWLMQMLLASVVVLIAPLAVVNPVGPRCFYPTYLLLLVIAGILLRTVLRLVAPGVESGLSSFLAAVFVAQMLGYGAAYYKIDRVSEERLAAARAAVAQGDVSVAVQRLPFPGYVHVPDPLSAPWDSRYKLFHDLPADLELTPSTE